MIQSIANLLDRLEPDAWRDANPFERDFAQYHERLIGFASDDQVTQTLNEWLGRYQPCLFGRLAAKLGAITYCILRESDLCSGDEAIKNKIQERRLYWSQQAYRAVSSAFVIIALSDRVSRAVPNLTMATFAQRLAFLYLRREIELDTVHTEEITLEIPGDSRITRTWPAGVNYFCAQGDGRWWQDHRIPGGVAFSVNSVGHLVRSGRIQNAFELLAEDLGSELGSRPYRIDSLHKALEFAMRTINLASDTPSGKATELLPLPTNPSKLPPCPVDLPDFLRTKNYCEYKGLYNTDTTLPSGYFSPEATRPKRLPVHNLDFTYLFLNDLENPDHETVAEGRRIRATGETEGEKVPIGDRRLRGRERIVRIEDTELLCRALGLS